MFKNKLKIVDQLQIGNPCPIPNFEVKSDRIDDGWFCHQCVKQVYDLAKMSRSEISDLVKATDGHFCAVITRRQDGSMITNDPMSASAKALSKGMLFASTALIATSAAAQTEVGGIEIPPPAPTVSQMRGDVAVAVTPTPKPNEGEEPGCHEKSDDRPAPQATPTVLRGKVRIEPPTSKTPAPEATHSSGEVGRVTVPKRN